MIPILVITWVVTFMATVAVMSVLTESFGWTE